MGGSETLNELGKLLEDFVDQTAFIEYFKATWVPKLKMWLSTMRRLPLASQVASGAIEAYHVKLKTNLFDDSRLGALQRVDWLVHKLTTELHSSYWLDRCADESDSFQNVKEAYINSISWHRTLQIPDSAVALDEKDHHFSKVKSQKDSNLTRLVWNPRSEFAFCDYPWSLQGNLCKHIIKVNMICESYESRRSSMSCQSLKETLLDIWRSPVDDSMSLDLSMALTFQMLDQIQNLVELNTANDISAVVDKLPVNLGVEEGQNIHWHTVLSARLSLKYQEHCKGCYVTEEDPQERGYQD